jgi:hypothetical protein
MFTTFVPPNVLQIGIDEKLDPSLESLARRFSLGWGFGVGGEVKGGLAVVIERRKSRVRVRAGKSGGTFISIRVVEWVRCVRVKKDAMLQLGEMCQID